MKKITKLLCLLLALCLVTGCASKTEEEKKTDEGQNEVVEPANTVEDIVRSDFPSELSVQKVTTITNSDINYVTAYAGGVVYRTKDNKYGILTHDGKNDTGAVYTYCKDIEGYFAVSKNDSQSNDVSSMNSVGLVDGSGKVIVPESYAAINVISDRYIKVSEVTEQTTSKDQALVYSTDRLFSFGAEDGDTLYKGNWYVYDITTGKLVDGVSGTKPSRVNAMGKYIYYTDDNNKDKTVDENGKSAPSGYIAMFTDGSYYMNESGKGSVYDADMNKLFDFDSNSMSVSGWEGNYYSAHDYGAETSKYFLLDRSGNKVSADFEQSIQIYGEYILSGNKLYDFDGKVVNEDLDIKYVEVDNMTNKAYKITTDDNRIIVMKSGGEIIYDGKKTNTEHVNRFVVTSNKDKKNLVYSYKDKDFTLEGYSLSNWISQKRNADNTSSVVDTISGKELITGYKTYEAITVNGKQYVYAYNNYDSIDVYIIQ